MPIVSAVQRAVVGGRWPNGDEMETMGETLLKNSLTGSAVPSTLTSAHTAKYSLSVTCCTLTHSQRSTQCSQLGSHAGRVMGHRFCPSGLSPVNVPESYVALSTQPGNAASLNQCSGSSTFVS